MDRLEEVMQQMDEISYGWLDIYGRKHINTLDQLTKLYRVSSPEEVLENKLGICFDQVELERKLFELDYETQSFAIFTHLMLHSFLILHKDEDYIYFEHSSPKSKGTYHFCKAEEALAFATQKFKENHHIKDSNKVDLVLYPPLQQGTTFSELKDIICQQKAKQGQITNKK